jgi:ABC-type sugar transport system ATPase subunit
MAKIRLRNVSLSYSTPQQDPAHRLFEIRKERLQEDLPDETRQGVTALDHVNLTIPNGQTFVVVGPSGCGKTTLLRLVAGLANDYTGEVYYDGEDVRDIETKDRYIGMVFQNYALYPNFSNEGNLSFFFKVHHVPDEATHERIRYTAELMGVGFKELLSRKPGSLSGGEKQRVAIARAIVRAPRLLLFDEPLSNLDAKLRVQTRTEIKRLLRRFSITSLYVTHDQVEAMALADQIVVMHKGRIQQVGTYQDLMANPVNVFVAGFLGLPPMNLCSGVFVSGNRLVLDEYVIPIPEPIFHRFQNNQPVTLGMRQEAVNVSVEPDSTNGIRLPAEVESFEPDFVHRTQTIHLQMGRWRYSGLCPLDLQLSTGQLVHAHIDPAQLYFFDSTSGVRL